MPGPCLPGLSLLESEATLSAAADALVTRGWWLGEHALDPRLALELADNLDILRASQALHRAGIGREADFQVRSDIRGDRIHWLSSSDPVQAAFLQRMEALRRMLNRRLFLGLFEFEAHYACYPAGSCYRRHRDSFRGAANRIVSVVAYLNADWGEKDGGELVLYNEAGEEILATIAPRAGRVVLFLSEEVPHEVLTTYRDRLSIAGWFRLNASVQGQIDPPR